MPPRISLSAGLLSPKPSQTSISAFLVPFLHQAQSQTRNASVLNSLANTAGSYSRRIRRGRGASSGKGKTSGRGHKGQKQHGKVPRGFQGGQTPEEVSHGRLGFNNVHHIEMSPVNLSRIAEWIEQQRIDPTKPITLKELTTSRAIHGIKDGVKLLAEGASKLTVPINIVVSRASQSAIAAVEALGGTVTTRYYTPQAIARIRQGTMHPYISLRWDPIALRITNRLTSTSSSTENTTSPTTPHNEPEEEEGMTPESRVTGLGYRYRLPDPSSRKEIEYYRNTQNRGYLAHTVKEGESASLYFRPPPTEEEIRAARRAKGKKGTEVQKREANRLW